MGMAPTTLADDAHDNLPPSQYSSVGIPKCSAVRAATLLPTAKLSSSLLEEDTSSTITLKQLQNHAYRVCGLAVLVLGLIGFAPSISKALLTGSLWSVSHDAEHTDNDFLAAHGVGAVVWTLACVVQLGTGGVPRHGYVVAHRISGYIGSFGLLFAMVLATANELKYATPDSAVGDAYTLLLVLGATGNMLIGLIRARQRRFAEHKDGMLLAIMFSMDPAVHRLAMWTIRFIIGKGTMTTDSTRVDADKLLILGKMPANLILYTSFGFMFLYSRRVNRHTVLCTGFNLIAFLGGAVIAVAADAGAVVVGLAMVGTAAIVMITAAFIIIERRARSLEDQ